MCRDEHSYVAASLVAQLAALAGAAAQQTTLDAVSRVLQLEAGVLLVPKPIAGPSRVAVRKFTEVRVHGRSITHAPCTGDESGVGLFSSSRMQDI